MSRLMRFSAAVVVVVGCVSTAQAVDIETVTVGNPGNADDIHGAGYGGVDYAYNMGTFEVTAGQYRDFLNAVDPAGSNPYGIYKSSMDSEYGCQITWNAGSSTYDFSGRPSGTEADWTDRPVNYVSWGDAARFCNWMHNGQGSGDTETGSYLLNGAMSSEELMAITREPGATWVIPTEDEWYKAAYYDGGSDVYFDYPTGSDTVPVPEACPGGSNTANYYGSDFAVGSPFYRNEAGCYVSSASPYGTFDQGGNVFEWNEAVFYGSSRGLRGGSFGISVSYYLHAANRGSYNPTYGDIYVGFRVAEVSEQAPVPTVSEWGMVAMALLVLTAGTLVYARRGAAMV